MPALKKNVVDDTVDNILGEIAKMQAVKNWDNYHLAELLLVSGDKLSKVYRFKRNPKNTKLEFLILILDKLGLKIQITKK